MLPLLNKISAYVAGAPKLRVGAALGRNGIRAAILHQHDGVWQIARVQEIPVSVALFEGAPPPDAVQVLTQALASLLPEAVGNFVPLHLALPGAAVSLRVFGLDAVPKAEPDRINLARWRMTQELAVNYELVCAYQILAEGTTPEQGENSSELPGSELPGNELLAIAMDGRWLACLTEACRAAQIVPTVIDAGYSFLFNHFHAEIAALQACCALICLESDSWSMLVIDQQARIRLARSWWRNPAATATQAADFQFIALEAEQAIRAYVLSGATPIQQISIAGEGADIKSLAAILDQRMQQPGNMLAATGDEVTNNLQLELRGFSTTLAVAFDFR